MQETTEVTQDFICRKIEKILHPKTKKSVLEFVSKILINDGTVVFGIKTDKEDLDSFKFMKECCEKELSKIESIKKLSISLFSEDTKHDKKSRINGVEKVIVVASGKGGVGKSTVAFNLALSLSKLGKKVGLVDVDIYGPSLPKLSGINTKPVIENNFVIPHKKFGIAMMSVGFLVEKGTALAWRGPMTTKMLFQLIQMTNWEFEGKLDYLIIDTPPGTGDVHLSLAENYKIDGAIIVSTPQELSTTDAAKGIDLFSKVNIPVLGIVQNMSYFVDSSDHKNYIFGKDGALKLANKYKLDLLADIPIFVDISESSDKGLPIVLLETTSQFSKVFESLASKVYSYTLN